jgi:hypothetical protein
MERGCMRQGLLTTIDENTASYKNKASMALALSGGALLLDSFIRCSC